jgi:hypothetical protein
MLLDCGRGIEVSAAAAAGAGCGVHGALLCRNREAYASVAARAGLPGVLAVGSL